MTWLAKEKADNVMGREEMWNATARAAEHVRTAAGRRMTKAFLAELRKFGADNLGAIARAVEANAPEVKDVLLERQEIVNDAIRRLEEVLAAAPISVRAGPAQTRKRRSRQ